MAKPGPEPRLSVLESILFTTTSYSLLKISEQNSEYLKKKKKSMYEGRVGENGRASKEEKQFFCPWSIRPKMKVPH